MAAEKREFPNFVWGSKSAIQKAIRRSDGPMLTQAFETLWEWDRQWLLWRMPVLAAEEVWPLLGKTHATVLEVKGYLKGEPGPRASAMVKKKVGDVIREMCASEKEKSPGGLCGLASDAWAKKYEPSNDDELRDRQWRAMRRLIKMVEEGQTREAWRVLSEKADKATEERRLIVTGAKYRYFAGGMSGDQMLLLGAAVIALTEKELPKLKKKKLSWVERTGEWPWYVYDMHTKLGKNALKQVMEQQGIRSYWWLANVWFEMESGWTDRMAHTAYWWMEHDRVFQHVMKMNEEKWKKEGGLRDAVKETVEGLLEVLSDYGSDSI